MIGRDAELARLAELLAGGGVVTLTGPGGVGKTRLATEFAERHQERTGDAVTTGLLAAVPARAPVPAVVDALGFESLDAATVVLAQRGGLVVLAELATAQAASAAVALFLERAAAAGAALDPTPEMLADVVELCRRLDGLPLAIELAAARTRGIAPGELPSVVDQRLDLLRRTRPAGGAHDSMRAAIEMSTSMLGAAGPGPVPPARRVHRSVRPGCRPRRRRRARRRALGHARRPGWAR